MRRPLHDATETVDVAAAAHQLAIRSHALVALTAPALIPSAGMLVLYLWPHAPHHRLLAWFGVISALTIGLAITAAHAWRRRRAGEPSRWETVLPVEIALLGTAVGVAQLVLPIAPSANQAVMVIQLFSTGVSSAAMFSFGPTARNFVAFELPANLSSALSIIVGVNDVPAFLAPLTVIYVMMLTGAQRLIAGSMTEALTGQARGERLLDELRVERDRVAAANEALSHQATHDPLTGVANRVRFFEQLTGSLVMARRRGEIVGVLFIDLDHFKALNDGSGHATGDAVLIEMARRLCSEVRVTDLVARQGGDEFTVLLVAPDQPADAVDVAERIRSRLNEPFEIGAERFHLTASLGLALNDDLQTDPDTLMRHADLALYRAKASGRNRVEILDASLRTALELRRQELGELREAFDECRIEPWFQPVVDIQSGTIVAAESLVRWRHRDGGLRLPGAFLPLVHEHGLDDALDDVVIRGTLRAIQALNRQAPERSKFKVSVNVDCRRSSLAEIVDRFAAALDEGFPVWQIALELTENTVINQADVRRQLERARSMGMIVALDDFGTGESPLSLVRDLPLDVIKIDRRFVQGMASHRADVAIVASVIELARALDVLVVAEGVERVDDAHRLVELGCVLGQGFLYSQAVPLDEFLGLVAGPPFRAATRQLDRG